MRRDSSSADISVNEMSHGCAGVGGDAVIGIFHFPVQMRLLTCTTVPSAEGKTSLLRGSVGACV